MSGTENASDSIDAETQTSRISKRTYTAQCPATTPEIRALTSSSMASYLLQTSFLMSILCRKSDGTMDFPLGARPSFPLRMRGNYGFTTAKTLHIALPSLTFIRLRRCFRYGSHWRCHLARFQGLPKFAARRAMGRCYHLDEGPSTYFGLVLRLEEGICTAVEP